ncbi:MAG: sigma-54 dependent transcriptional regulator [Myxococcaceae bacterium]
MPTLLIIDDDPHIRESLRTTVAEEGHRFLEAGSFAEGRALIARERADLILLDVFLGDGSGVELLEEARRRNPDQCVVMISGESDIATALQAIRLGAYDFLEKPLGRSKLRVTVRNALASVTRTSEVRDVREAQLARASFTGASAAIHELGKLIARAADSNISVLVTGENGTGKEIAARRLHLLSKRWARPMVQVNCAAIPAGLLESELFGHVKGSFTGALSDRPGHFIQADGGTIFLDEIGDMDLALQAKLLRVLQESEVTRVGESTPRKVDVRVIAATNQDLRAMVREGRFREDLYYRLAGLEVHLPPLRERREDLPQLVSALAEAWCVANNRQIPEITPEALSQLSTYGFPGNVRELTNVVQRTLLFADQDVVTRFLLPQAAAAEDASDDLTGSLTDVRRELMRRHLTRRLAALGNDPRELADELGIHLNNLYRMFRDYGVQRRKS